MLQLDSLLFLGYHVLDNHDCWLQSCLMERFRFAVGVWVFLIMSKLYVIHAFSYSEIEVVNMYLRPGLHSSAPPKNVLCNLLRQFRSAMVIYLWS